MNIRIRDADGRVRFRIELGYEGSLLAIEYDGKWHDAPEQKQHDETRRSGLSTTDGVDIRHREGRRALRRS